MASTELPEDDEAWLYGESDKKDGDGEAAKNGDEEPQSTLSAEAQPFEPSAGSAAKDGSQEAGDDKEAGEVSGEDADNADNDDDDDEDSDDDDVQVTIGDIKTQPTHAGPYEKFKSSYTRSGQAPKSTVKGVDLDAPGTIDGVSVYDYDLNSLNAEDRPWRKPGADITDYFNYGFTEETWVKYCEKQKISRQENGGLRGFSNQIHSLPPVTRPRPSDNIAIVKTEPVSSPSTNFRPPTTPTPNNTNNSTTTTPTTTAPTTDANGSPLDGRRAGPPPGRKMSGTIDVIGGTRNDSRRPKNQYDYDQNPTDNTDFKKWPPHGPPPTDLPPPHIPPPGYGPPPPMNVPPPGPPPPHMGGPPPMSVPPPGMQARLPTIATHQNPFRDGYYPPPSGVPPPDRGPPPPGYDNRSNYGGYDNFGAPPPGYGAPPPNQGPPPSWDNRGAPPYNEWEYGRERSPARSDSDFSSSGDEFQSRFRGNRDAFDSYERDLNYERNRQGRSRPHDRDRGGDRDRERERERSERDDRRSESRGTDRERRHRGDRERPDREKEDRHRKRKEGEEHRSSKHKKSKRSKRDREDEAMDTSGGPSGSGGP